MVFFTTLFSAALFQTIFTSPTLPKANSRHYNGYHYKGNPILDGAICVLFEGVALTATGATSSTLGLIVK